MHPLPAAMTHDPLGGCHDESGFLHWDAADWVARLRLGAEQVLELDHVLVGVADLSEASIQLSERHGLATVAGGRHPEWGTENKIVPLGGTYVELVTVADPVAAASSVFGRWVTSMLNGEPVFGWAVRTNDMNAVAGRLGLADTSGSRVDKEGQQLRWRLAGVAEAAVESALPFFIEWGEGTIHPGLADVRHPAGETSLSELVVGGGAGRLRHWLGRELTNVAVHAGPAEVRRVVLSTAGGTVVLDPGYWARDRR